MNKFASLTENPNEHSLHYTEIILSAGARILQNDWLSYAMKSSIVHFPIVIQEFTSYVRECFKNFLFSSNNQIQQSPGKKQGGPTKT